MLAEKQIDQMLIKLKRFEKTLSAKMFYAVDHVEMKWFKTPERLYAIPDASCFASYMDPQPWGGENTYCWFHGTYAPSEALRGKALYLYPKITGYEALLWLDGKPSGIYAAKFIEESHGNHYCNLLTSAADRPIDIALEYYTGNYCVGSVPLENEETRTFLYETGSVDICLKDMFYADFLFDLKTLNQLAACLDENSFRRADVLRTLMAVHARIYYSAEDIDDATFRTALMDVHPIIKDTLSTKNAASAPTAGIIGHSHMDTAWLWTMDETIKKCARTYSNQLRLMEQYPEYLFVQSSAFHSEMIRRHYPDLFERIKTAVKQGRYEPNGGVWIECDCNIPSGELMARQFLWGQRYTQTHFGYTSDTFWLPDTFGYNAAIPQIMKLSDIDYFLTTKIAWNDTTVFPYDSFWWRGIDGTEVLTHFNKTHVWPDAESLIEYVADGKMSGNCIKEKSVTNRRLISFGYGDGGGGPQFEMLEMARRVRDLDGVPKAEYTTVSHFMHELERGLSFPSTYTGELYLELHRGTLTNQHQIKRNNRLGEIALHNLEYLTVRKALYENQPVFADKIHPLTETLLNNQFHDILPGTSIPEVHAQSLKETTAMILEADNQSRTLISGEDASVLTISNTTSFDRSDVIYLHPEQHLDADLPQQITEAVTGEKQLAVAGLHLQAYSSKTFSLSAMSDNGDGPFLLTENRLETPFASITFDAFGYIRSFKDKSAANRELCDQNAYAFNTFLMAEDVPVAYDNWDIDADIECKFRPVTDLISRAVISNGCVELRIRSVYRLSKKSTLTQDMIFYAESPLVRFETLIDWQDHHRFLKTAFDTTIHTTSARHEIQFSHVNRPTTRNSDAEKAHFEVCAHKYSDLSESRYGITLLNDCKYGVSAHNSSLWLSLHKGGTRPDYKGDLGLHLCSYALLPHHTGFSSDSVVKPAYLFNYPPVVTSGRFDAPAFLEIDADHIVAETIKPCEDGEKAYIVRLYECEGATAHTSVSFHQAASILPVNLLENPLGQPVAGSSLTLSFHPFEIKTLKVFY